MKFGVLNVIRNVFFSFRTFITLIPFLLYMKFGVSNVILHVFFSFKMFITLVPFVLYRCKFISWSLAFQCDSLCSFHSKRLSHLFHLYYTDVNSFHEVWRFQCDSSCVLFIQNIYHIYSICIMQV